MNLISVQILDIDIDIASDAVSRCAQPLNRKRGCALHLP